MNLHKCVFVNTFKKTSKRVQVVRTRERGHTRFVCLLGREDVCRRGLWNSEVVCDVVGVVCLKLECCGALSQTLGSFIGHFRQIVSASSP